MSVDIPLDVSYEAQALALALIFKATLSESDFRLLIDVESDETTSRMLLRHLLALQDKVAT